MSTLRLPRARGIAGLVLAALAVLGSAVPVAAGASTSDSAWVVVRRPTVASYTVPRADRRTTGTGAVQVLRAATGYWRIELYGIRVIGGNVGHAQVTPIGSVPAFCWVDSWSGFGSSDHAVTVRCVDATGASLDTRFALVWMRDETYDPSLPYVGYAWNHDPSTSGTPVSHFQHLSLGGPITVTRSATGRHVFTIPGAAETGYVAVGPFMEAGACRVVQWAPSGSDTQVEVLCRSIDGTTDVDRGVLLYASDGAPVTGFGRSGAYLLASEPSAARYVPAAESSWSSEPRLPLILRTARGRYEVRMRGHRPGGAAIVTAYGPGTAMCQLSRLPHDVPARALVRCFSPAGKTVDAPFTMSWVR